MFGSWLIVEHQTLNVPLGAKLSHCSQNVAFKGVFFRLYLIHRYLIRPQEGDRETHVIYNKVCKLSSSMPLYFRV